MPTSLTDADKVIRNDTGLEIAAAIRELAAPEADRVGYDNTSSGLTADNAQDAIDELKTKNDTKMDKANPTGIGSLSLNRKAETTIGGYSTAEGLNCEASANYTHAEGSNTVASGLRAHAEGNATTASGQATHTEGYATEASGQYSHAEGQETRATAQAAHVEGRETKADGHYGHAEGYKTTASGERSHAEGSDTTASGNRSHSEGTFTIASRRSQHVFGEYNIADTQGADGTVKGAYIEIVGKGSNDANRSNARTLDWNGNETLAGGLKLHENQDAATLSLVGPIATGGGTLDCSSYSDGAIIYLYRPTVNKVGIYAKADTWTRVIPIMPISTVSVSGYVITNNDANEILHGTVIST